jgi:hypothetical protein
MFKKTVFALLAALVLTVSYGSAQAQTNPHGCVSGNMEEGAASAYPAWQLCNR